MKIFGLVISNKIHNNPSNFGYKVCYIFAIYNRVPVLVVGRTVLLLFDVSYFFFYKIVLGNFQTNSTSPPPTTLPLQKKNNQTNNKNHICHNNSKKRRKLYFRHVRVISFDHPAELTLQQFYDNTMTNLKSNDLKLLVKPLSHLAQKQQNTFRATKKKIWFVNCNRKYLHIKITRTKLARFKATVVRCKYIESCDIFIVYIRLLNKESECYKIHVMR